jgi:spermidine synthase
VSSWPRAIPALAFASGALALVYEVLWMRRFVAVFGATAPATAATVAATFLGLAAGSAVLGRATARFDRPLRAFGWLELGIAASALAVGPILALERSALAGRFDPTGGGAIAIELVAVMVAIFAPTFLMGGSLPALAQSLVCGTGGLGQRVAPLYAGHVAGGAVGALVVPFALLPRLGANGAYAAAVAGSALVGIVALGIGRGDASVVPPPARERSRAALDASSTAVAALAFVSGATTLALEVLWTRMLALVHESSTHAFAVVLATFLVGLAAGALLARVALGRGVEPRRALWAAWLGAGALAAATPHAFWILTSGLEYLPSAAGAASGPLRLAAIAGVVLLPPVALAGMALPCVIDLAWRSRPAAPGATIGRVLAWNLAGSVAGPLAVAFGPVPRLGLWAGISLVALVAIVAAAAVGGVGRGLRSGLPLAVALAIAASWAGLPPRVRLEPGERLVSVRDGALGTVATVERAGGLRMKLDNFYGIGGTASTGDERWQGHLPLLLHPRPRTVAFLGLGTGITAGASVMHDVERVVAVELVPEVVEAAREDFAPWNLGLAADPRIEIVVADARSWLAATPRRFDVVVSDLVVPWRRGEAALFTLEHVVAARDALAPGGVFCQWVPAFQLSREEMRIVARTFLVAFPDATVWLGDYRPGQAALALVGWREGGLDPAAADRNAERLAGRDPANPHLAHRAGLWIRFVGPLDEAWAAGAPVNREAWPRIELGAHRGRPFAGRELTAWLDALRARPVAALDAERRAWREIGAELWRASLLAEEGEMARADAVGLAALAALPEPIRRATLGGSPPPGP